jgi:copper chaperone
MSTDSHVVLNVPSISCNHCKMAIERAVAAVDGVSRVEVDVVDRSVDVLFDPSRTDLQAVKAAVVEEGYEIAGEHSFGA